MSENNQSIEYNGFQNWLLKKGNSAKEAHSIIEHLQFVNHYYKNTRKSKDLYLITDSKELVNIFRDLRTETAFHVVNTQRKNKCYDAINAYIDYIRDCAKAARNDKDSSGLEKTLDQIFSEKKYHQFLSVLKDKNITNLEQLSRLPLYFFMNENNIAVGRERLALLCDITATIEDVSLSARIADERVLGEDIISRKIAEERVTLASYVEYYVKKKGLTPVTIDDIRRDLALRRNTVTDKILFDFPWCVEIKKDRYIHRDNIVDLEEAADTINGILKSQFEKFQGYSTSRLLCDAVRIDLPLFLNDNDFEDEDTIYLLTKHLFSKECYGDNTYIFYGNVHIWQREPTYPKSIKGLLIHYARMTKQTIRLEECEIFLKKLGFSSHNIKQQMEIKKDPTFLQYDKDEYLLGETLGINEEWTSTVAKRINLLFHDNVFVIPRDIQKEWYESLPKLPFGQSWTCLLLQDVLGLYPEIGYRTIPALAGQGTDTIHAAIVPNHSSINTFADFVSAFLFNEKITKQRIAAEDLRLLLRKHGAIEGNELFMSMHKALNDYRFAWDNENKTVFVNLG